MKWIVISGLTAAIGFAAGYICCWARMMKHIKHFTDRLASANDALATAIRENQTKGKTK